MTKVVAPVQVKLMQDVFVLTIENPPVNAISLSVRQHLMCAVTEFEQSNASVAVLIGANGTFVAGADLREFGKPLQLPALLDVVQAVENCKKPIVAALQGSVLGGGFELALACDARVAHANTVIGLPEVSLGVIPGAGGTQLLPRRVGICCAIDLICGTQRVSAEEAKNLKLVDAVVHSDVLQAAILFAKEIKRKSRIRDEQVPAEDALLTERTIQKHKKNGKCRPAIDAAIDLILSAAELPIEEGLALERAAFQDLRASHEAQALRHLFFAESACKKSPFAKELKDQPISTVCVVGAGLMGVGIAICLLDAGISVLLLEQNMAALGRGQETVSHHYRKQVNSGKLSSIQASECLSRLSCSMNWDDVVSAELLIEAVYEDLSVKQEVFKKMDQFANSNAILATNTSYLDVNAIALVTDRPQRVLGLHFFSPANVMKLLEVVSTKHSQPEILQVGMRLGSRLKKFPVLTQNSFGFIGNRIYNAYRTQCEFMLEDGAWPEEIDAAITQFGMAMGPFSVADLSGLDIAWRMRKATPRKVGARYVDVLDKLCETGRLGRKTNAGYYDYVDGQKLHETSLLVRKIIEAASQRRGITRQSLNPEDIQRRAILSMVNEAALLMSEGVAQRTSDIDVVLVHGYGFPRWRGGPVFWARQQDPIQLQKDISQLAQHGDAAFVLSDTSILFEKS